ncbi:NAD(P)-binding protein [Proteinivorax hydrogeniformans]|uniref:NAD(P)-binding protein n=1 Tax=Proteinivorax hydrogeniformans TaxID=1826727 RepID=A0AAU8HW41_9FIRM
MSKNKKKVAIMGAGIAGLSCTYELEKFGITPDVFEIMDEVSGQGINHTVGWMKVMYRPIKDPLVYLKKQYGFNLRPIEEIRRVNFYSNNNSATLEGNLGYIHLSGPDKRSLYYQLLPKIKTPIKFSEVVNFRDLAEDYEHVVIANGNSDIAELCGLWKTDVAGYVRGATVYGDFDPQTIVMWFNTEYAQHAYAYFVPWSDRKGSLILNMLEVTVQGADTCWQRFLDDINWNIEIAEIWEKTHHLGHLERHIYDNLIFTGAAGGFLDPLFAFGNIATIESGGAAAKHIAKRADFNKEVKLWLQRNHSSLRLRRYVDKFSNEDFDKMLDYLKTPGFRTLATRANVNLISLLSNVANTLVSKKIDTVLHPKEGEK